MSRKSEAIQDEVFHFQHTGLPEGSRWKLVRGCIHTILRRCFLPY